MLKNSIFAGLAFGLLLGLFFAFLFGIQYAAIAAPITGIAFGASMYFFVTSKTVAEQTKIENTLKNNPIIHSGAANHFINKEAAGGKLCLFANELQFQSHNFNIQNHSLTININEIREMNFYNTLGLIPNGLSITQTNGQTEKFVVGNRKLWKEKIEQARAALKNKTI